MAASRLEIKAIKPMLVGNRPTHYASFIELHAPFFPDAGELISLGDRYTVSLGAHQTHATLLMDKSGADPLTIEKSLSLASLLAYVTDSPVVPVDPSRVKRPPKGATTFSAGFRGTSLRSAANYLALVSKQAELADSFLDMRSDMWAEREFPIGAWDDGKWVYIEIPNRPDVWRALGAYSAGMLSILAPARLLNFWRALEAVTPKSLRQALFQDLARLRARPVWSRRTVRRVGRRHFSRFNAIARLRRRALIRWNALLRIHRTPEKALDHLFWDKRGKAAHADRSALDYEGLGTLGEQLHDADLLRYVARVAIDRVWL